jgi:peroxiredoxin
MDSIGRRSVVMWLVGVVFWLLAASGVAEVTTPTAALERKAEAKRIEFVVPAALQSLPAAPDFALQDVNGKTWSLQDFRGNVVVLNFFASWCAPCRMEAPHIIELNKEFSSRGVKVIGITLDTGGKRAVEAVIKKWGLEHLVLIADNRVNSAYKVLGIPYTLILTPDLKIYQTYFGYRSKDALETGITALLKELGHKAER